jgi:hypothetical protein
MAKMLKKKHKKALQAPVVGNVDLQDVLDTVQSPKKLWKLVSRTVREQPVLSVAAVLAVGALMWRQARA